jgi:hypothetical protein
MYSLLLPLNADAGRHIAGQTVPHNGYWANVLRMGWSSVVHRLAPHSR